LKEIFYISNVLAAFNSFGLFSILYFRKKNSTSNIALSAVLLIPALYFVNSIIILSGKQTGISPYFFFLAQTIGAFFPSAVYVFIYALLSKQIQKLNLVFITSFIISLIPIYYFRSFLDLTATEQNLFFEQLKDGAYPDNITFYNIIFYTFQQLVFAWLLKICYDFKRKSKDVLSNIKGTKFYYLQVLLWAFFSLNIFLLLASLFFDVLFVEYLLLPVSLIILHSTTVYYGFKNAAILSKDEFENNYSKNKDIIETIIPKSKATLTIDELSRLEKKIVNELKCNSIYKDTDITLAKMSKLLDIPTYKLSITINEKMNTSFYDLINSKRIDASLSLLKNNKQFTIEAIALEVGFKSKSTFYRAFKKYKGITPTNFISKN